jgi:hypothetical protein
MVCAACNKESNNRRVCPYCFTPYPAEGPQSRGSTTGGRMSGNGGASNGEGGFSLGPLEPARAWFMRQTPVARWSAAGIVVVGCLWLFTDGPPATTGTAQADTTATVVESPMSMEEAVSLIRHTRTTALVEEQSDEVNVSYPAATFPIQPDGQVMLARQFARADEVVNGRKRRIVFHSPSGRKFAQSDAVTGLTVVQ